MIMCSKSYIDSFTKPNQITSNIISLYIYIIMIHYSNSQWWQSSSVSQESSVSTTSGVEAWPPIASRRKRLCMHWPLEHHPASTLPDYYQKSKSFHGDCGCCRFDLSRVPFFKAKLQHQTAQSTTSTWASHVQKPWALHWKECGRFATKKDAASWATEWQLKLLHWNDVSTQRHWIQSSTKKK